MRKSARTLLFLSLSQTTSAFLPVTKTTTHLGFPIYESVSASVEEDTAQEVKSSVAAKFKVLTCTSTACAKRRKQLSMDEYATFGAMFSRAKDNQPEVQVEESPCLGSCQQAPCIAVEHEDYVGTVALEGMEPGEFSNSWYVLGPASPHSAVCVLCL